MRANRRGPIGEQRFSTSIGDPTMHPSDPTKAMARYRKWNLFLISLLVSLVAAAAILMSRRQFSASNPIGMAMSDERLKATVVADLVRAGKGIFDSHVDPIVGRVLQPGLDRREFQNVPVSTNYYGLRERNWAEPKPAGITRVALLGDSYIFGEGTTEEERVCHQLEKLIAAQTGRPQWSVEVLAIAVPSWNIESACAWLRRALDRVEPDLVLHVSCANDLDDVEGVRGFGSRSRAATAFPMRADGRVTYCHPVWFLKAENTNRLIWGVDWESQEYYRRAREAIENLAGELDRRGVNYTHVYHWSNWNAVARKHLQGRLRDDQQAMIPEEFYKRPEFWIGPRDQHWNALGSTRVAELLYSLIRQRDLLPGVELPSLLDKDEAARTVWAVGEQELPDRADPLLMASWQDFGSSLDTRAWTEFTATLVHGGIDFDGYVSPYASVALRNVPGGHVRLTGRALDARVLDGARVAVYVDELSVGTIELVPGLDIDSRFKIPPQLAERPFLSVRFQAGDWVYTGGDLQHTIVFQLHTLAIEAFDTSGVQAAEFAR
jgi:hypothetical protein